MKKVLRWFFLGSLLVFLGIFGWQVFFYYRMIKSQPDNFSLNNKIDQTNLVGRVSPFLGNPQAKIILVEFADFTCPFSKQVFSVIRELLTKRTESVYFVFRHFPLADQEHLGSQEAALSSFCAQQQGKFWAYHDKLFQNQKNFTKEDLISLARQIGLNEEQFVKCLASAAAKEKINEDIGDGLQLGVAGTPTFFVNGQKVPGAVPLEEWEKVLEKVK